jgi:toxin CptA
MLDQRIAVAPSMMLAIALGAAHLAAAGLLWLAPIPTPGKAVFTFAIAVSLIYLMARTALLHAAHSIVVLEIREGREISFQTRIGEWIECDLLGSSYVSPRLTIVNLRPRGRRLARHVILVPDNVDPRDFRRLRMWLRWKRDGGSVPATAEEG